MPCWSQHSKPTFWEKISLLSTQEKRAALEKKLQKREPIKSFSDIKPGDHLVQKCSIGGIPYRHHFLCTGLNSDDEPTIIHYHNTSSKGSLDVAAPLFLGSGVSLGRVASIKEINLPHKDLVKSESELQKKGAEVERVVWPDGLRRFPVEEVIQRARTRLGERYYDLGENNCESFVMWCICGLNFSLQCASSSVMIPVRFVEGLIAMFCEGMRYLPKIVVEAIERGIGWSCLGNAIGSTAGLESFSLIGSTVGFAFGLAWDVGALVYNILVACKKWKNGIITRREFIEKIVKIILVQPSRCLAGIAGFLIFQFFVPIPVVSGMVGFLIFGLVGHLFGACVAHFSSERIAATLEKWISKDTPPIDRILDDIQS